MNLKSQCFITCRRQELSQLSLVALINNSSTWAEDCKLMKSGNLKAAPQVGEYSFQAVPWSENFLQWSLLFIQPWGGRGLVTLGSLRVFLKLRAVYFLSLTDFPTGWNVSSPLNILLLTSLQNILLLTELPPKMEGFVLEETAVFHHFMPQVAWSSKAPTLCNSDWKHHFQGLALPTLPLCDSQTSPGLSSAHRPRPCIASGSTMSRSNPQRLKGNCFFPCLFLTFFPGF